MATLNPDQQQQLAALLRSRRQALGLSAREVGRRAGLDNGTIARLEKAANPRPTIESLTAIARALDIPAADLLTIADWLPNEALPTFTPYLRTKYHELPESALAELEDYFQYVQQKHRVAPQGPTEGEDE